MATTLDKPLIRETGLINNGRPVFVMLMPSEIGGSIIFREKGKKGKGIEITLQKVLESLTGGEKKLEESRMVQKVYEPTPEGVDLVNLGTLETRLMVDGEKVMTPDVKGRVFQIIREIREERREEVGAAPLITGRIQKGKL